jgi:Glycosyl hydrolases family 16
MRLGKTCVAAIAGLALTAAVAFAGGPPFTENWTGGSSPYFTFLPNGGSITSNVADSAASDGRIVQLTIPANPAAGTSGGPNLQSGQTYGFGTYEARFKTSDCSSQPNTGMVSGFFTFFNNGTDQNGNGIADNSEIDFEWLCAEPNVMWLTQWTDYQDSPLAMKRIFRELDLASGTVRQTCYSEGFGACTQNLTGSATEGSPTSITPIPGYNSATAYYTYGFTWLSNRLTWYVLNASGQKITLWDYQGPASRITQREAYFMFNTWYTNSWPPTTNAAAIQAPNSPRSMKIDWAKYSTGSGATPTSTATATATATSTPTATATARATPTRTPTPTATTSTGTATIVSLASAFNVNAAYTDGTTFSASGGIDGVGSAYSSTLLGSSLSWAGTSFNLGATNQLNGVRNATITLPAGQFTTLMLLGTGVNGDQASQAVRVNYTDGTSSTFTQTFSNWLNASQNVAGQQIALTAAYRNKSTGVKDNRAFNLYGYSFALTSTKTVSSLVLPASNNVVVLAATLRTSAVSTPTATATATSRATATRTATATATAPPTATPTTSTGLCAAVPAFATCTAYASGAKVVFNNALYHSIAPIPNTRDCPPSSPFDPSTDNWWVNDGGC